MEKIQYSLSKSKPIIVLLFVLSYFSSTNVRAQLEDYSQALQQVTVLEMEKDLDKRMIPLDSIISLALVHSPYIKQDSAIAARQKYLLKANQWSILNEVQLVYQFSQGNQSIIFPGVVGNNQNVFNGYRYGVNVGIPIGIFFTRPNQVKASKADYSAAMYKIDQSTMQLKRQIVEEYTKLLTAQKILRIKTTSKENAMVTLALAEKKYKDAALTLEEMSHIQEQTAEAETRYEAAKGEFITLFYQFEILVGVPFVQLLKK